MNEKTICLDMDGVLADFVAGMCIAHGRDNPYTTKTEQGDFFMEREWGITTGELWDKAQSNEFWENLPWMPDGEDLLNTILNVVSVEQIFILTRAIDENFVKGKIRWVEKHTPELLNHLIIVFGTKEHFAAPDNILIDDYDLNVMEFTEAGGKAILVPRPWNANWEDANRSVTYVQEELEKIVSAQKVYT